MMKDPIAEGKITSATMSSLYHNSNKYRAVNAYDRNMDTNAATEFTEHPWFSATLGSSFKRMSLNITGWCYSEHDVFTVSVFGVSGQEVKCGEYRPKIKKGKYTQTVQCGASSVLSGFKISATGSGDHHDHYDHKKGANMNVGWPDKKGAKTYMELYEVDIYVLKV